MNETWMESIAGAESREEAREWFDDWLKMKEKVHDEVTFVERNNDVAVLHIDTGEPTTPHSNRHVATKMIADYAHNRNPVRCIDMTAVFGGIVQLNMLLAELCVDGHNE
jgi:hypothetical protein